MREPKVHKKESITVAFLVEKLRRAVGIPIESQNGLDGSKKVITEKILHRPGLALAGYIKLFTFHRVQVLGNTECEYLAHLSASERQKAFNNIIQFELPCIFLTSGNTLDEALCVIALEHNIPIFQTPTPTTKFMSLVHDFLADQFALQSTIHGALIDVYGIGLLITGKSGVGKSEVALDLIERGHRLVADDIVVITKKDENILMGSGTDLTEHFMEIRGLGLVDVRAMFGIRAIRFQKRVEVLINLQVWNPEEEYTRLGIDSETQKILDVPLPLVKLPILPGKNVTVICEVIAMNHLLRHYGYNAAEVFAKRLQRKIQKKNKSIERGIDYFEHDYE